MTEPFTIDPHQARVILPADAPRHEWETERLNGIGGSDIATAAGVDPYSSPFQLWLTKTRRVDPNTLHDDETRNRFRIGHKLEPVVLDLFAEDHPWLIVRPGAGTYAVPDTKHHRVNVDGLAWTPNGVLDGVIEAKTANHRQAAAWTNDEAPVQYVFQCQWAMYVTGAPRAYLVALVDTHTLITRVIDRDEEIIAELVRRADEFWRLVETDTPPEPDPTDSTRRMLGHTHTEPDSVIELPDVWEDDLQRRDELAQLIKDLEREKTGIENRLRAHMGEHETAVFRGRRVATFKRSPKPRRKVCDDTLDALRDHQPDAYHQIVTETPQPRVLRFTTN